MPRPLNRHQHNPLTPWRRRDDYVATPGPRCGNRPRRPRISPSPAAGLLPGVNTSAPPRPCSDGRQRAVPLSPRDSTVVRPSEAVRTGPTDNRRHIDRDTCPLALGTWVDGAWTKRHYADGHAATRVPAAIDKFSPSRYHSSMVMITIPIRAGGEHLRPSRVGATTLMRRGAR